MEIDLVKLYDKESGASLSEHLSMLSELYNRLNDLGYKMKWSSVDGFAYFGFFLYSNTSKKNGLFLGVECMWWKQSQTPLSLSFFDNKDEYENQYETLSTLLSKADKSGLEVVRDEDGYPYIPLSAAYLKQVRYLQEVVDLVAVLVDLADFGYEPYRPKW